MNALLIYSLTALFLLVSGCALNREEAHTVLAPVAEGADLSLSRGGAINIKSRIYKVHQGDTLYAIAWAFGVDYRDLAQANHLQAPYALHPGQSIRLAVHKAIPPKMPSLLRQSHAKPDKWATKKWCWPTKGHANTRRPWRYKASGESGINIAGQLGMPVRASAPGVVVYSGKGIRGYGNLIIVKHSDDLLSAYAYNEKCLVKTGDRVKAGQHIALMGFSPRGKPRLHFEIRHRGKPVNPLHYLI